MELLCDKIVENANIQSWDFEIISNIENTYRKYSFLVI